MRYWTFFILLAVGCTTMHPGDWWQSGQTDAYTFSLPPTFQKSSPENPSLMQYTNEEMTLMFNDGVAAGGSLDSLSRYGGYTTRQERIGAAEVQIVTFEIPPGGGHRFDHGIAASFRGVGLTIYAHCRTKDDYALATQIFETVRLKPFHSRKPQD